MGTQHSLDAKDSLLKPASAGIQRLEAVGTQAAAAPGTTTDVLRQATAEAAQPLDTSLRDTLETGLGHDFSGVRVHSGPHSESAAERIGARAYTLGNDVHLGAEARALSSHERRRLLTHEAVHTVQQGSVDVAPHAGLAVSNPNDAAETEAESISAALHQPGGPSRSLALRDRLRGSPPTIARMVAPQLQRDLTSKHPVTGGEIKLDLKTESHPGAKSGMSGTIKFKANDKAPDSANIRLLQVAKLENLSTGKDYVWTGGDANRNKVMTTAEPGVAAGWFVDHNPAKASPRTKKSDAAVSPYYRDYWPNASSSQDGSKKGKAIAEASLWDYPGWSQKCRFSFETVAKAADTGHVYGTVAWGFTISDGAKGTVEKEHSEGRDVTLLSTDRAVDKFDEFYRNPGSSKAPLK